MTKRYQITLDKDEALALVGLVSLSAPMIAGDDSEEAAENCAIIIDSVGKRYEAATNVADKVLNLLKQVIRDYPAVGGEDAFRSSH